MGKVMIFLCQLFYYIGGTYRTSLIHLNESSYEFRPDIFRVGKCQNMALMTYGIHDGLQEYATYDPPGPTKPGWYNRVRYIGK